MPMISLAAAILALQTPPPASAEPQVETRVIVVQNTAGEDPAAHEREMVIRIPGESGSRVVRLPHDDGLSADERIEVRRFGGPDDLGDMDADHDGRVSEAEFTAPLRDAFARMDADRSGFLEGAERGGDRQVRIFTRRETPAP